MAPAPVPVQGLEGSGHEEEFGRRRYERRSWVASASPRKSVDKSSFIQAPSRRRRLVYRFRKRGVLRKYRNIKNEDTAADTAATPTPTAGGTNLFLSTDEEDINILDMKTRREGTLPFKVRGVRSAHGRVIFDKSSSNDEYRYSTFLRKMSVEQITLIRRRTEPFTPTPWDDPELDEREPRKQLDLSPSPWQWAILSSPSTSNATAAAADNTTPSRNGRSAYPQST